MFELWHDSAYEPCCLERGSWEKIKEYVRDNRHINDMDYYIIEIVPNHKTLLDMLTEIEAE